MPYNDEYNQKIARDTNYINKRFVEHTDALGTAQTINYRNPSVSGSGFSGGRVIGGGVGCAEWKGATASKHEKGTHAKCPCGGDEDGNCMCGEGMSGGTNLGFKSKDPVGASLTGGSDGASERSAAKRGGAILGLEDNTILGAKTVKKERKPRNKILFGSLGNAIPADMGVMAPTMPSATAVRASAIKDPNSPIETLRKGRGRSIKHTKDQTSSPMKAPKLKKGGNGFASGTHMDTGEGPATLGVTSRKTRVGKGKKSDVVEFVKKLIKPKRSRVSGSGKQPVTDEAGNPLLPTTTKRTVKSTPKKEVQPGTEKAQLPSSTLSGLGKAKKHNPRAEVVKKVMAEHGMKMIEASKYVKEHGLY
jgi:hypothetical protein